MGANWWVIEWWDQNPVLLISWVVWIIFSITLHELGHGWAAIRRGDRTPIETGHMTWNPIVHMGTFSLILFALVGICWGAMPVDPSRFRGRHAESYVAAAGPAMNLMLFTICTVLLGVWTAYGARVVTAPHIEDNIRIFLLAGAALNLALMLFNLIPVPPLDGSRILADYVPSFRDFVYSENGMIISLIAFAVLFNFAGNALWDFAFGVVLDTSGAIGAALP